TDFNVAHSHMTMYGIIAFFLWACIYAILPKLTGKEPPQVLVGAHFWLAFIGLFAYMISMMWGGTYKGLSWIDGHPFLESVTLMISSILYFLFFRIHSQVRRVIAGLEMSTTRSL